MKKLVVLFSCIIISVTAFSQVNFKFKGVGGGISIGADAGYYGSSLGINAFGLAQIMDKIDAEANIIIYFPGHYNGVNNSFIASNGNGHYNFYEEGRITAYALGGLNISRRQFSGATISGNKVAKGSFTRFGLNIGAGGAYEINNILDGTAQIGYTLGNYEQLFINLGVFYKF